jgi:hypothetical protein
MWSLNSDNGKGAEEAVRRAHELVLKPQREGGGNNIYRGNIPPFVAQMPQQERVAWVAMELIRPPRGVGAYLVRSVTGRVSARVMNEFGVFGWALFGEGREVREEQVGWLVRTKAEDVDDHHCIMCGIFLKGIYLFLWALSGVFCLRISCRQSDWQLSSLAHFVPRLSLRFSCPRWNTSISSTLEISNLIG